MIELVGHLLADRYQIIELIARRGMADVYRGKDTVLDRPIAITILTERSDDIRKRFLREAQSIARLNHRNIVSVYDAGQSDGLFYIVMELLEGHTLDEVAQGELTVHDAIRLFIDLLEALAYAHEQGIIHRDVKPANVMVLRDGTVKIMGFGLSRRTSEMSSISTPGDMVGTIAYLSPERFLGKITDARSDLYSVGVVMYEVFTGTVPFRSDTDDVVAVIFAHVNDAPIPLRSVNRAVPAPVERIVMRLLEKEPQRRYQNARELIADLNVLIGVPTTAPRALEHNMTASSLSASHAPAKADDHARDALYRTFSATQTVNEGYANTLTGMLATRKRNYPEAIQAYTLALRAFAEVQNDLEHAKTALKYAMMISQKNSELEQPNRKELDAAAELMLAALPVLRGSRMPKELEEGERVLYALQRIGVRFR